MRNQPAATNQSIKEVLIMDKSEILWAIACVVAFAYIGVILAWRG